MNRDHDHTAVDRSTEQCCLEGLRHAGGIDRGVCAAAAGEVLPATALQGLLSGPPQDPGKVRPTFEHRVLEITEDIMLKWRLLVEEGRNVGHT